MVINSLQFLILFLYLVFCVSIHRPNAQDFQTILTSYRISCAKEEEEDEKNMKPKYRKRIELVAMHSALCSSAQHANYNNGQLHTQSVFHFMLYVNSVNTEHWQIAQQREPIAG